ncbi:MAG: hypothetical protein U0132_03050 [Gemmatimonadaceae bacterium]
MRAHILASLVAMGAVLPFQVTPAQNTGPGLRAGIAAVSQPVLMDTLARPFKIMGERVAILGALVAAYDSLGIPMDFKDSKVGIVVAERFQVRSELKKVPLSKYLDCGQGFNGVNANVYRLTLVVASWITPQAGDPSEIQVAVAGSGQDMAGSNAQSVLCTSKGVLEEVLVNIARRRLSNSVRD